MRRKPHINHGAFGALAFGIGALEAEHVLATQTLVQQPAKSMLIRVRGRLGAGVTAKDVVLAIIGRISAGGPMDISSNMQVTPLRRSTWPVA